MTKIEQIREKRKKHLESLSKGELMEKIMNATVFSDTYFLVGSMIPTTPAGLNAVIRSMHNTLSGK